MIIPTDTSWGAKSLLSLGVVLVLGGWIPILLSSWPMYASECFAPDEDFLLIPDHSTKPDPYFYNGANECIPCSPEEETELVKYVPKLVIAGTLKGGTSFLSRVLGEHPNVTGYRKEAHILNNSPPVQGATIRRCEVWREYKRFFSECEVCRGPPKYVVEKTPAYLYRSYVIPARFGCVFPKPVKLIFALRDPTDRAFSQYQMNLRMQLMGTKGTSGEFYQLLAHEQSKFHLSGIRPGLERREGFLHWKKYFGGSGAPTSYLSRGLYALQLTHWIDVLSDLWGLSREELVKNYFLFVDNDEVKANMKATADHILSFAGLPPYQYNVEQFQSSGTINNYTSMSNDERKLLDDFFRPYNAELHNLLQRYDIEIGFAKQAAAEMEK